MLFVLLRMLDVSYNIDSVFIVHETDKLDIIDELDLIIVNDENKTRFIDYDIEFRRQELDDKIMRNMLRNRLNKKSYQR